MSEKEKRYKGLDEAIESKLLEQAKQGSQEAFEKLVMAHEKTIYAICLRMLCNEQEAYDAAQEVCLKVWKQLGTFEGNAKFTTWLYRIATNQCLDMLRKQKRKDEISLYQENKETGEVHLIDQVDSTTSVDTHIEQMALQDVMAMALGEIKEDYKKILVLRDMQGYSYEEIAAHLELNTGTVKSRLSRARAAIKKVLMQNKEPYQSFFRQKSKREGNS